MSLKRKNCRGLGFLRQSLVSTPSPTSTRPAIANGCETTICTAVNILSTKLALSYQHFPCYHQWLSSNHMYSCQYSVNKTRPLLPALILSPMAVKQPYAQLSTLKLSTKHTLSYQHFPCYRQWLSNNHMHSCQHSNSQPSTPSPTSTFPAIANGCQATICTAVNTLSTNLALSYQLSFCYHQWLSSNHMHSCQHANSQPSTPSPTSTFPAIANGCQATICTAVNTLSTNLALSYQLSFCYHQWLSSNHMYSCQHSVNKSRPLLPLSFCYHQWLSSNHMHSCQHSNSQPSTPSPTSTHPSYHHRLSSKYVHSWQHSVNQAHPLLAK